MTEAHSSPVPGGVRGVRTARWPGGALRFAVERLVFSLVVLVVVLFLVFALLYLAPGSPELALTQGSALNATPKMLAALREEYGLDRPFIVQLGLFIGHALTLDFGTSPRTGESVTSILGSGLAVTLPLIAVALVFALIGGVGGGILAAARAGSSVDRTVTAGAMVWTSVPPFVTGVLLIFVFGVLLPWFPVLGAGEGILDRLWHLVLPGLTLALLAGAGILRVTRAVVAGAYDGDYIVFARARGMPWTHVMWSAVRNSMVQIVTVIGSSVVVALSAVVIVENVFNLRGLGYVLVDAINNQDIPVVQGGAFVFAVAAVVVNAITDFLYLVLDPRIRHGELKR